ncbi:hypothetical protein JTB14_035384 [Gonioctena quinquepunctata]|nr:hypothetical protein JTB14_035384 [Gonioctena quinquepunctata]
MVNENEEDNNPNTHVEVEIGSRTTFGLKSIGEVTLDFSFSNDEVPEVPSIFGITQDPWPSDVKLFQCFRDEQMLLPDVANCLAVEAFLNICDLNYKVEQRSNAEAMSPTLKLPFIKAGKFVISELDSILQFVNGKGITLTDNLDIDQRADMRAFMSLVTNVLELAELYICWFDEETYNAVTSRRNGFVYPWPLNHFHNRLKRSLIKKRLVALEWYHKSIEDVQLDAENCCEALSIRLDRGPYFFGMLPTQLDALVFGHLSAILTVSLPNNNLRNIVEKYPRLLALVKRIDDKYFENQE